MSADYQAGFTAYDTGISYPRDWAIESPFKAGWEAAADSDMEAKMDSDPEWDDEPEGWEYGDC